MAGAPFGIPAIIEAQRALLVADATLVGLLAPYAAGFGTGPGMYNEGGVPPKAAFPYLTVGAATEVPFDTMGPTNARGSQCTIQWKAFSAKMRDDEVYTIAGHVKRILDECVLTVTGYGSSDCHFDFVPDLLQELVGGLTIRQLPMIFRVYVHQT